MKHWLAAGATALVVATAAIAQMDDMDMDDMDGMDMAPAGDLGPAAAAYAEINEQMHAAMMVPYTGDPDVDFVLGMIPHHQGAVEMAKVVLEYGSDPEIRALAEEIIAAQEAEIAFMQAWLAANGE